MQGNLVACVCDDDFDSPVWALAARRDLDRAEATVALDLYATAQKSEEASQVARLWKARKIVLVASSSYFRSFEPVLRRLQAAEEAGLVIESESLLIGRSERTSQHVGPIVWILVVRLALRWAFPSWKSWCNARRLASAHPAYFHRIRSTVASSSRALALLKRMGSVLCPYSHPPDRVWIFGAWKGVCVWGPAT